MKLIAIAAFIAAAGCVFGEVIRTKVAILGGGISGTIAARTLAQAHISDFLIIEARNELGGRLMSTEFAGKHVELGANWILGTKNAVTRESNPIWDLALKYLFLLFLF
jgi:polyamine oxidase